MKINLALSGWQTENNTHSYFYNRENWDRWPLVWKKPVSQTPCVAVEVT